MSSQLDRIEQMLRALCAHLGVQDLERSENGPGQSLGADAGQRHTGVVSRFEHGWGFIECEALNRNFFVHYSDIEGTGLRSLDPGEAVSFEVAPGRDGRPKAIRVKRLSSGQPTPRMSRPSASPRVGYRHQLPEVEEEDDSAAEAGEPLLAERSAVPERSGGDAE